MKKVTLLIITLFFLGMLSADTLEIVEIESETVEVVAISNQTRERSRFYQISNTQYKNYLGFSTGLSLRAGISFRHWFGDDNNMALQIHLFPFLKKEYRNEYNYLTDEYESKYVTSGRLKVGLTHMFNLQDYSIGRLVYWTNVTFGYNSDSDFENNDYYYTSYTVKEPTEREISGGTGPGLELHLWRINFDFLTGISGYYNIDAETYHVYPAAEVAAHIRF